MTQDKEIYRWPIKESIKAMLAWEWTLEKARDGEGEVEKKATTRKISQTAQVQGRGVKKKMQYSGECFNAVLSILAYWKGLFLRRGKQKQ